MQTLRPELDSLLRLTLAEASWSVHRSLLASRDFNQLFKKLLIVSLNLSLLDTLLVLMDPLLVPEEPLLAVNAGHGSCAGTLLPHGVSSICYAV